MLEAIPLFIVMGASSGYLFCNHCLLTRYGLARDEGQRFYIKVISWGCPFLFICIFTNFILFSIPSWLNIDPLLLVSEDYSVLYTALSAPFLAYIAARAINYFLSDHRESDLFIQAMTMDDFDAVLLQSMTFGDPVAISMESRKIYVGYVYTTLEPGEKNSHLTILPLLSGYRDRETLEFKILARYELVISALRQVDSSGSDDVIKELESKLSRYTLSVPRTKIVGLHLFNQDLHEDVRDQYRSEGAAQ